MSDNPVPVAVLLQREMKIAVIENEYGAVSIDTALVEENVREVRDGCRHHRDERILPQPLWTAQGRPNYSLTLRDLKGKQRGIKLTA